MTHKDLVKWAKANAKGRWGVQKILRQFHGISGNRALAAWKEAS